ncbi:DinB family protein [bacterium]|nr:MAG: DinB family protein [bacterium]
MSDFHAAWSLSRGRYLAELDGLNQEQLNWRLYPGCLSIAEAAIHVAGVEARFGSALEGVEIPADLVRVAQAATEGVVNDNPFPFTSDEMTPEFVLGVFQATKQLVEPALLDPTAARREVTMVSALGPVITGEGAMARLAFHPAYHQGQAYQLKNAPGFPA